MRSRRFSTVSVPDITHRARIGVILLVLLAAGCGSVKEMFSSENGDPASEVDAPKVADPVDYDFDIDTDGDDTVRSLLNESSVMISRADRPPASLASLNARIDEDVARFEDILRSQGFYNGSVTRRIDTAVDPVAVTMDVQTGPAFKLAEYDILYRPQEPTGDPPRSASDIGLEIGQVAAAAPLVNAEQALIRRLTQQGYPRASISHRRYLANRQTDTIRATITVDPGPFTTFGELSIDGLEKVEASYILRVADWKPGIPYDSREVARVRTALVNTQLFSTVSLKRDETTPPPTVQPIEFLVEEGPPRSVGVGATFSSDDEGFGGQAFWEHRNLFGRAEQVRVSVIGNQIRQELSTDFRKPNVLRLDQSITAEASLLRETSDAFDELSGSAYAGIERVIADHWTVNLGPTAVLSRIEQQGETDGYLLIGARGSVVFDNRNDPLNPTTGIRASVTSEPYISVAFTETEFIRNQGTLAGYQPIIGDDWVVLAGRTRLGSIALDDRFTVPANLRFYAGGGGSVRGYAFRTVGPLDDDNDPEGALSVVEINTEVRVKIIEEFGIVGFVDGGQGFEEKLPKFDEEYLWAAGFGLRYYSSFGPLRFDMGFPINPRDSDDPYQFYISIGQAF